MLKRQAKVLSDAQQRAVLAFLESTTHPERNRVIFLLSVKAGLRAREIAAVQWGMLTDAENRLADMLQLPDHATKHRSGRIVPLNKELRSALATLQQLRVSQPHEHVAHLGRALRPSAQVIVNLFHGWYRQLGFDGCSSHSGRRTFITQAARKISTVGGSLRDVQALAGHRSLSTTQIYIDSDSDARRRVVNLL